MNESTANDDTEPLTLNAVPGRYVAEVMCRGLSSHVRRELGRGSKYVAVADLTSLGLLAEGERPDAEAVDGWCRLHLGAPLDFYADPISTDALRAVIAGVDPDRKIALSTLNERAGAGDAHAANAVAWLRNANVVKRQAVLTVTAAELMRSGASAAEVAELPAADMAMLAASARTVATWAEAERLERRTEAARMEAARAASEVAIPERVNLAEYVPDPVPWVVDGLMPRCGVLGLFAERKAGKSKVVLEMVDAGLGGSPFLGRFPVRLSADAEVVLFDTEMPLNTLHAQYRRAGVPNLHRLNLRALRGVERSLDARVDAVRARWREQIAPGSLIIVDCLYSLFGAVGVSENSDEVVAVLAGLRTLATECEAAGLVIVHHLGKDTEKGARGHSSIEGFPDVIARIEMDGSPSATTERTFSAFGRDVAVEPGALILGDDHRLRLGANPHTERMRKRDRLDNGAVWELIENNPGLSLRGLSALPDEVRGKLSRDRIRDAVSRLERVNAIANKGTPAAPEWHALTGVDPFADAGSEAV